MLMVGVNDSSPQVDPWSKLVGLVWRFVSCLALFYIHQMKQVNSRNDCHDHSTMKIVLWELLLQQTNSQIIR